MYLMAKLEPQRFRFAAQMIRHCAYAGFCNCPLVEFGSAIVLDSSNDRMSRFHVSALGRIEVSGLGCEGRKNGIVEHLVMKYL